MENTGFKIIENHNFDEIKRYWLDLYGAEELASDETIRVVPQIKFDNGEQKVFTINNQINSLSGFLDFIKNMDNQYGIGKVGYSISSAIFHYDPENKDDKGQVVKPNAGTFKRIKNVVVDIDFHMAKSKDRFVLGFLENTYIDFAILNIFLSISEKLQEAGIDVVKPKIAGMTGSGLQIVFEMDRELYKDDALVFLTYLKKILGGLTKDLALKDQFGNIVSATAEVDTTFADLVHVQRVLGSINQKYFTLSKYSNVFEFNSKEEYFKNIDRIKNEYLSFINEAQFPITTKEKYNKYITHIIERIKTITANESVNQFFVDKYLQLAKMEQYAGKTAIRPSEMKNIELDLIYKLKEEGIKTIDLIRDLVKIDHESSRFIALKCPFHEDTKYSFAIYINDGIDVLYDFHDGKSYNLVSFWEKIYNVNKTTAISQISQKAGIKLGKGERKDFQQLEIEEIVDHLLDKIDLDKFIYYRLANKNRVCIVRHKDTGEAFVFDGPKMIASHVLQNQLKVEDADKKLQEVFYNRFQERILIDAFEEFHPGKPTVFQREFIKFVNLWVPSKNYLNAHERAKELKEELQIDKKIPLEDSIQILKEKTPWTFKYIQQLTQKGNLLWFINWLANGAKYQVMPTIPVIFGVPGVGKNLFVTTILEWYHNNEYTKVMTSDRLMSNFNSILENASMVVLDEGDVSNSKEFDFLKFLSGNKNLMIEKKGQDVKISEKFFNIIMFSNGDIPVRHSFDDRRIQYFKTEQTLLQSCKQWGITIDDFIENVEKELEDFWGILLNISLDKKWSISNEKDKLYIIQILKQHSFGELILKLLEGQWRDIALQLNENISDPALMKANLELLKEIKEHFENESKLSLTLINRYLNALNFKYKTSIQRFIQRNSLQDIGIDIEVTLEDVLIKIDKEKLQNLINVPNVLTIKEYKSIDRFIRILKKAIDSIIDTKSKFIEDEKIIESQEIKVETDMEASNKKELESIGIYDKDSPEIDPDGLFKNPEVKKAENEINKIFDKVTDEVTNEVSEASDENSEINLAVGVKPTIPGAPVPPPPTPPKGSF